MLRLCDLELHGLLARGQLAHDHAVDPIANGTILGARDALDAELLGCSHADLNDFLFRVSCLGHRLFACRLRGLWQANIRGRFVSCSHTTSYVVIHTRSDPARTRLSRMRLRRRRAAQRACARVEELLRAETREIERGGRTEQGAHLAAQNARMDVETGGDLA